MPIVMIVNPVAGARKQRDRLRLAQARLRAGGVTVETAQTCVAGDARRLAREAIGRYQAVMAVGGDGTVAEVVDGLSGSEVPLLIWPTGTENLIAKALGFRAEVDLPLTCLSQGRCVSLDLGVANGRSFLAITGVGFDAEAVHRLSRVREGHITHFAYVGPLWRTFWEHRFPQLSVTWDGRFSWQGRGLVFIGNLAAYALQLPVVRDARADDGLLDLLILPCSNQLRLIQHSILTLAGGRHIEQPDVRYERVKHVRIESAEAVPVEVDGDEAGCLPLEVTVRPGAIRVLVPPLHASG